MRDLERDATSGVPTQELRDAVHSGDGASLASIWKCPACGAQIQVIVAPDAAPDRPFTCVDGTQMVAGDEH